MCLRSWDSVLLDCCCLGFVVVRCLWFLRGALLKILAWVDCFAMFLLCLSATQVSLIGVRVSSCGVVKW